MRLKKIFFIGVMATGLFACVPLKQFDDLKKKSESLSDNNQSLKEENRTLTVDNNELDGQLMTLQRRFLDLEERTKGLMERSQALEYTNERLIKNQSELEKQIAFLKDGSSEEISKLLNELQELQRNLQEREDRVRLAEDKLQAQEQRLKNAEEAMAQQQARMMELQDALDKQKEAVTSLRNKLNHALMGFYDQGLSVYEKNGKVYVSLEENLLFKTGSYNLDPKGQDALRKLSEVLANNPEINIMVEGHTDDVPLAGTSQIKDNWDLSVMRATAVTKIILGNPKIDPKRITAAGRGEFTPLDPAKTPEARRKNRRTEIVLTPNLSEVLEIIQAN
jgi:chemotaxis protein MotB